MAMTEVEVLRARIDICHKEIIVAMRTFGASESPLPHILQKHAEVVDLSAQIAEIASQRLERHTKHLIILTYVLVAFTAVLLYFTKLLVQHP